MNRLKRSVGIVASFIGTLLVIYGEKWADPELEARLEAEELEARLGARKGKLEAK